MSEEDFVDGRTAAELYRHQIQAANARRSGFEPISREDIISWAEANKNKLENIVRATGAEEDSINDTVMSYISAIGQVEKLSDFDDAGLTLILSQLVNKIEEICLSGNIPIRDGVSYGITPRLGLDASQLAVMGTQASIISITHAFPTFCNLISKAIAISLIYEGNNIVWDPDKVRTKMANSPQIKSMWCKIILYYAAFGCNPDFKIIELSPVQQVLRVQILWAMELFVVAHEYGHHVLKHGVSDTTNSHQDPFHTEHEADIFARLICLNDGLNGEQMNVYSASGAGAVLLLCSLDLIQKAEKILLTGRVKQTESETHPPLISRIDVIAGADEYASALDRPVFEDVRLCAQKIINEIWTFAEPVIYDVRNEIEKSS